MLIPLTNLLQNQSKKNSKFILSDDALSAFNNAKEALVNYTKLFSVSDSEEATLTLTTDASADTVGAILHQESDNMKKPLSFFSVKLNSAQLKYSTFSCEFLVIYLFVISNIC